MEILKREKRAYEQKHGKYHTFKDYLEAQGILEGNIVKQMYG